MSPSSWIDSISKSAASLGLKRIEGRVYGLFEGSVSACTIDLMACNCEANEELILAVRAKTVCSSEEG